MKKFKVFEQECWGKDNWTDEEYYCDVEGNSLKEAMEDFNNEQYHECEINDDTITMYIDGDWETSCTREYRFEEVKELSEDDLEDLAQDLLAAHWGSLKECKLETREVPECGACHKDLFFHDEYATMTECHDYIICEDCYKQVIKHIEETNDNR